MAQRGRPRKYVQRIDNPVGSQVTTRDPAVTIRDPPVTVRDPAIVQETQRVIAQRKARRYIAANMPTVCPDCGHNTRQASGRHIDQVRRRILEYRTCIKCKAPLAAGRDMTRSEVETLCTRADAMREYEESLK